VPDRLQAAMAHGALNGGKRLRPFIVMECAALAGAGPAKGLPAAIAIELVHCYSLVHDDLPSMDDDDLRRGKPTVHKAFDEATAILAGDGLLTQAFSVLAGSDLPDSIRVLLVKELAGAAGAAGMVGGQVRDLEGESGGLTLDAIAEMQAMKTGALIRAAARMGAIAGHAPDEVLTVLTRYGEAAGRAFQLADDLLDVTASSGQMGKATGKDAGRNKPTLIALIGRDAAYRQLGDLIHNAITALTAFGPEADGLRDLARYFAERES
jgi:farnesyl diphosphate synthase